MTLRDWLNTPGHTIGEWTTDDRELVNRQGVTAICDVTDDCSAPFGKRPIVTFMIPGGEEDRMLFLSCPLCWDCPSEDMAEWLTLTLEDIRAFAVVLPAGEPS